MDESDDRVEGGEEEPVPQDEYLSSEQVEGRLGLTPRRLRLLVERHLISYRGSSRDPFFRARDLPTIKEVSMGRAGAGQTEAGSSPELGTGDMTQSNGRVGRSSPGGHIGLNRLIEGDALSELRKLPPAFVQTVVTSPPFWGQRVYEDETAVEWPGKSDAVPFGREKTPEEYAAHSVQILGELARVLKPRGTIWWNIADSYMTRTILHGNSVDRIARYGGERQSWAEAPAKRVSARHDYLKDKDLALVPFLIARDAQHLGLWLRSIIVWSKQQPTQADHDGDTGDIRTHMPEPVGDRPVTGHEYVLLFAKSRAYDYHAENIRDVNGDATSTNVRTVWNFRPADKGGRHGARFPEEMPRRCIALGSNPGETVLDPFAGHGTTLRVAQAMDRNYLGIEISPTYIREALAGLGARPTIDPPTNPIVR